IQRQDGRLRDLDEDLPGSAALATIDVEEDRAVGEIMAEAPEGSAGEDSLAAPLLAGYAEPDAAALGTPEIVREGVDEGVQVRLSVDEEDVVYRRRSEVVREVHGGFPRAMPGRLQRYDASANPGGCKGAPAICGGPRHHHGLASA